MPITQQGAVNLSALNVPNAYVQIVPPQYLFGGVSTNINGIVGTAAWGPVGIPQLFGSYSAYVAIFGNTVNRKYDMGGHVIVALAQGAASFYGVRVTDGTDTAATVAVQTNCLTLTGKYTGSFGASIRATFSGGTQAGTQKVVIVAPGIAPETFDNIGFGLSGTALWAAIASAINSGAATSRTASNLVVATTGSGTTSPAAATYTLAGGSDGATAITTAMMLGVDTNPRKGMYALRGTNAARFMLCDLDDSTSWAAQNVFALDMGAEAVCCTPAGDTIASATAALAASGIDSYGLSVLLGDWVYFFDTINNVQRRMISPQSCKLGLRGNLSPQLSSLNKPLGGIIGTQSSLLGKQYSQSDLAALSSARIDVVALDGALNNSFIFRLGINTSSNPITMDESYTDVTNFLAKSLLVIASKYIGQTQTDSVRRQARTSLVEFLAQAQNNGILSTPDGAQAYQVVLDGSNNAPTSVALGYMYAYVKAIYGGIIRYFIVNLEGGASVSIQATPPTQ